MFWYVVVWLVLGGLVGWIASIVMRTDAQQGVFLNVIVGIAGALIGAAVFYWGDILQPVTMESFVVALLGSILLLALINLFRRGSLR